MQAIAKTRPFFLTCAVALFWCWNIVFICVTLPMLPSMAWVFIAWQQHDMPFDFAFIMLTWVLVPWLCVSLALTRLQGRAAAIAFLFFALEGPFFSLCLYRLTVVRELTPALLQWLLVMAVGLGLHGIDTWLRPLPASRLWHTIRILASAGLALAAIYAGVLALLGWTPFVLRGLLELFNPVNWFHVVYHGLSNVALILFYPIAGAFCILVVASLVAMPVCLAALCLHALVTAWNTPLLPRLQRAGAIAFMVLLQTSLFAWLNHQPQRQAFAALESPTLTAAQFRDQQSQLRAGLLNAYLGAYRYASSTGESNGVADHYHQLLWLPTEVAAWPQAAFNALAKPLLYDGKNLQDDAQRAAELYARYFDTPIQRGERQAIAQALSASHNRDEVESGLINIDQRKVRVSAQSVQVQAHGDLASITLDETYINLTAEPQEIFYLFSLPESAAITGLWLGNDKAHMQPYTLAPRGAAQRVYRAQVQRFVDPALLEQVGPRQYRLRAFPVPGQQAWQRANSGIDGPKLYLRLQYTALAVHGAWPLPVLAEKRNVAWDTDTERRCNGGPCPADPTHWWPQALPSGNTASPGNHAFRLEPNGPSIVARPSTGSTLPVTGKKVTLLVDRSWSMVAHRKEMLASLAEFRQWSAGNTVNVLLGTTPVMHEPPRLLPLADVTDAMLADCMGGGTVDQLLQQAADLVTTEQDLTIVLTDAGAFDLSVKKTDVQRRKGMLSMVHLGGAISPAYDDNTLETIQSSGGSAFATLHEAWDHFVRVQHTTAGFLMHRDGYDYTVEDTTNLPNDSTFAPMAARLLIAQATRQATALTVAQLDNLHAMAQRYSVVTPYSSMLVLVNTQQQEDLEKAQSGADRFDRAQESGNQTLAKPSNPLSASATPEPEEWLLLLVSLAVVTWMVRRRRTPATMRNFHVNDSI